MPVLIFAIFSRVAMGGEGDAGLPRLFGVGAHAAFAPYMKVETRVRSPERQDLQIEHQFT